ncbi:MAG: S41 family peptidase [Pirellulales bacterium]
MAHSYSPKLVLALLIAFVVAAAQADDNKKKNDAKDNDEYYELFEVFADSLDQIERNYVKEISRRKLVEAAIRGMIKELDQHSSYINRQEVDRFRTSVENQFGGIGIHVSIQNGWITVVSPLVGSPAYRARIIGGDQIIEIEGKSSKGITLTEAVGKLKGKVGTDVNVTLRHGDKGEPRKVTLTRGLVKVETVLGYGRHQDDSWKFMYDDESRIGYIRLSSFGRDTAKELRTALEQLQKQQIKGLILDLRFNPGGLLSSAIEISDLFVEKGLIVSTKGRNVRERKWHAKKGGTFKDFPMAVLINRYSASASEIVSACLKDHDRVALIGERTFGKGSVQNVIELEDGDSVLKLTTASYWRPNGKNIHRFPNAKNEDQWGVRPSDGYALRMTDEEIRDLVAHQRGQIVAHGMRPDNGEKEEDENKDDEKKDGNTDKKDKSDTDGEESKDGEEPTGTFTDRHLEKAIEYLSTEIARVDTN